MNSENRAKLIGRIQTLEGLTDDERSALLELLRTNKQYGLVWENKPEDVEERLRDELPVLIEDESKRIISDNPDAPNHILIEGDNLEALTTLAYTHAGRIDVIYIDPPYNTGNKDFTYYDDFTDEYRALPYVEKEDSFRHSKWLSFMSKRLRIARRLLNDRGVIFISIDDNEQANLKLLCDEVFGEKNLICQFIWQQGRKSMAAQVAVNHEYCLVYSKNKAYRINYDSTNANLNWYEKKEGLEAIYSEFDRLKSIFNDDYKAIENGIRAFYKSLPKDDPSKRQSQYKCVDKKGLYFPGDIAQGTGNGGRFDILHPITGLPCKVPKGGWRFSEAKLPMLLAEDRIHFGEDEKSVPCLKRYLKETEYEVMQSVFYRDGRGATKRLEQIMHGSFFDHPKDEEIIAKFIHSATAYCDHRSYIILDFFAGSGTTLHSVMQLNEDDGGKRQCILVTNNENGICEEVTYERNKRVINGYTKPNGDYVSGLHDNSLRYYRTAFVSRSRSPHNLRKLVRLATDMLCIKEDLYEEKKVFAGQETIPQAFRYFEKGDKRMMVIYREEAVPLLVPLIEQYELPDGEKIHVYVFSPSEDPWAGDFVEVQEKVELCALPMAILNAYKRVLPKQKDQNIYVEPDMVPDQTEEENEFSDTLFPEEGGEA